MDQQNFGNYMKILEHKRDFAGFDEFDKQNLKKYLEHLEHLIRIDIMHGIAVATNKLDKNKKAEIELKEKRLAIEQIYKKEHPHLAFDRHSSTGHAGDKKGLVRQARSLHDIASVNADLLSHHPYRSNMHASASKPLFDLVSAHPKQFKTVKIAQAKRKMAKTAGLERGNVDIDQATEEQRAALKKLMTSKEESARQKEIFDICFNFKERQLALEDNHKNFIKTKDMISQYLDNLDKAKERGLHETRDFLLRRPKSVHTLTTDAQM